MGSTANLLIRWALFFAGLYLIVGGVLGILELSGVFGGLFSIIPIPSGMKVQGYVTGALYIVGGLVLTMISYSKTLRG